MFRSLCQLVGTNTLVLTNALVPTVVLHWDLWELVVISCGCTKYLIE